MDTYSFQEPWNKTTEKDADLLHQLNRELTKEHPMFGKNLELLARRFDMDEILVKLVDENKYAVVHLTGKDDAQKGSDSPWTSFYNSIEDAVKENI